MSKKLATMEKSQVRGLLSKMLHESILQMCKVSAGLHNNIKIDGIICIANEDDEHEIVVKIHEQIECNIPYENRKPSSKQQITNMKLHNNDSTIHDKGIFPDRDLLITGHNLSDKEFMLHEDGELFGDLTAIKAITPLNRSEGYDMLNQSTLDTVVNLIDDDTVAYCESEIIANTQNINSVLVKPDPGPARSITNKESYETNITNPCSVAMVLGTISATTANSILPVHKSPSNMIDNHRDYSSDDDLKIEKLKAGRVRKNKRMNSESSGQISPEPGSNNMNQSFMDRADSMHTTPRSAVEVHVADTAVRSLPLNVLAANNSLSQPDIHQGDAVENSEPSRMVPEVKPMMVSSPISKNDEMSSSVEMSKSAKFQLNHNNVVKLMIPDIIETGVSVKRQLELRRYEQNELEAQDIQIEGASSEGDVSELPREIFNMNSLFSCQMCQKTFTPFKQYHLHMFKIHATFPCPCCDKMFKHRVSRNRHMVTHHGPKTFSCPFCQKDYVRGDTLKKHLASQHPNENVVKISHKYNMVKKLNSGSDLREYNDIKVRKQSLNENTFDCNRSTVSHGVCDSGSANDPRQITSNIPIKYDRNLPSKFEVDPDSHTKGIYTKLSKALSDLSSNSRSSATVDNPASCYVIPGFAELPQYKQTHENKESLVATSSITPRQQQEEIDQACKSIENSRCETEILKTLQEETEDIMNMIEISDDEQDNV